MNWSNIGEIAPSQWAQLLDVESNPVWPGENSAVILHRQLDAPLLPDLLIVAGIDRARLERLLRLRRTSETFLQHLTSNDPHLEILETIKAFARHIENDASNPLHGEPALVIYFSTIASAMLNCHTHMTSLVNEDIQNGLEWTLGRAGIESLVPLITGALNQLR